MITKETTLNQAFINNQMTRPIITRYGFNMEGNCTISQVAKRENLNENFLVDTLNHFAYSLNVSPDRFKSYSIPTLVDYLEKSHRYYIEKKLPEIEQTINILSGNNRVNHPALQILELFFFEYRKELFHHFELEETLLFPYAHFLYQSISGKKYLLLTMQHIEDYSIQQFAVEHENSHQELSKVRSAILSYNPTTVNISPYRILLEQLKCFEQDLQFHTMIEDDILVPKLREIEKRINHAAN